VRIAMTLALQLTLGACQNPVETGPSPDPWTCPNGRVEPAGVVQSEVVVETSGLVGSRRHDDILWVHNDSGGRANLYAMSTLGELKGVLSLQGATANDWEDLAIGPGPGDQPHLYVGDIGDNSKQRAFVTIYRVPEPAEISGYLLNPAVGEAVALTFVYPEGPRNAELLWVDPLTGDIYIMSKEETGQSVLFRAEAPHQPTEDPRVLEPVAELLFGDSPLNGARLVTGGDISADGQLLLVRTYTSAFVWHRQVDQGVAEAVRGSPCRVFAPPPEPQGEAVGFVGGHYTWFSLSEMKGQTLFRVESLEP
jgi:hypothetical protein